MKTKINTLQDLANWINSDDFNAIELERIIAGHEWAAGNTDDNFGTDGIEKIVMQENGKVAVVPLDLDTDTDMELALAMIGDSAGEANIHFVSRDDIDSEDAELIRFTYGHGDFSCVAVRYNDGTIFVPYDWCTSLWDNEDWKIEDTTWVDVRGVEAINLNGMPRLLL
uniref:Uncharacterized protein n=1 Tax=uncultured bacterium fosmid pJB83B9 TaxID=1478070 RepID=A0A0H3U844_9BACT|nr:hypothetical protein [uncultured bacterium fosmid pJB83B9]